MRECVCVCVCVCVRRGGESNVCVCLCVRARARACLYASAYERNWENEQRYVIRWQTYTPKCPHRIPNIQLGFF